ncbi:MAG: T9SS type A sorting domain-containing protein [Arcicella sp.]|nr:T9SS type A sorting domain-containing protein [Arcicella sp.]
MKKNLSSKKTLLVLLFGLFFSISNGINAQTYNWTGAVDGNFYNASNWTSTSGPVVFDDSAFKFVRTHSVVTNQPTINQFTAWQPGVFDNTGGNLIVNADFNVFFNDVLNGTVTVNTGAIFTCRNIFRVGSGGLGTLNVNGGTFRSSNTNTWQGIFIGVLSGGNGTANINAGGIIDGGYQLEIGTRDFYPTGELNVNTGGMAIAYWATVIGPNGTLNVNGGDLYTGETFTVGDLFLDTPGNAGTVGTTVGKLNINSGTVTVNQNDLAGINFNLHANAKVIIDGGSLIIKRTGIDFSSMINAYVTGGQIVPAAGKAIAVTYDGTSMTTVIAIAALGITNFNAVAKNTFTIYPNPVQNYLNIMSENDFSGKLKVAVVNLAGQTIIENQLEKNNSGSYNIDIKNKLSAGVYLVKITTDTDTFSSKIIVK